MLRESAVGDFSFWQENFVPQFRNFKVRYFRSFLDGERLDESGLHSALRRISATEATAKLVDVDGGQIFLANYAQTQSNLNHDVWLGEMRRLRVDDRVAEGDGAGNLDDVELREGRHVSECSYFATIPSLKILAYFSSVHAVTWSMFRSYLNEHGNNRRMLVEPIPNLRKIEQFQQMHDVRKVIFRVANPQLWGLEGQPATHRAIEIMGALVAEHMTIELSNGRARGGLSDGVRPFIRRMLGLGQQFPGTVEKMYVEGYTNVDGTERLAIDLLSELLVHDMTYDTLTVRTIAEYEQMSYENLRRSVGDHMIYLIGTFTQPGE